ncbi:MAG: hypothetical protein ABII22_03690 [Candidatus Micrarchaeota archaeon]
MKARFLLFLALVLVISLFGCVQPEKEESISFEQQDIRIIQQIQNNLSLKVRTVRGDHFLDIGLLNDKNVPMMAENVSIAVKISDAEGGLYFEKRFVPSIENNYTFEIKRDKVKKSFYSSGTLNVTVFGKKNLSISSNLLLNKFSADEARFVENDAYMKTSKVVNETVFTECLEIYVERAGYSAWHNLDQRDQHFRVDVSIRNTCHYNVLFSPESLWLKDEARNFFPPTSKGTLNSFYLGYDNSKSGTLLYNIIRPRANIYLYYKDLKLVDFSN